MFINFICLLPHTHIHTHSLEQTCRDKREEVRRMNNKMEEQRELQERAL